VSACGLRRGEPSGNGVGLFAEVIADTLHHDSLHPAAEQRDPHPDVAADLAQGRVAFGDQRRLCSSPHQRGRLIRSEADRGATTQQIPRRLLDPCHIVGVDEPRCLRRQRDGESVAQANHGGVLFPGDLEHFGSAGGGEPIESSPEVGIEVDLDDVLGAGVPLLFETELHRCSVPHHSSPRRHRGP